MVEQNELPMPDSGIDDTLDLLQHVNQDDLPRHVWPKTLADMVDVLVAMYCRRGWDVERATDEARQVVLAISLYAGAKPMYLPKGETLEAALRHAKIWHAWNGKNAYELAEANDLTLRQIQNIIKDQMRYRRGLRQQALPLKGE